MGSEKHFDPVDEVEVGIHGQDGFCVGNLDQNGDALVVGSSRSAVGYRGGRLGEVLYEDTLHFDSERSIVGAEELERVCAWKRVCKIQFLEKFFTSGH